MSSFKYNKEDGNPESILCLPFKSCFYARNVCALLGPMSKSKDSGRNVVDRGHLLVQRELCTYYLRVAIFHREATSEHEEPGLVVPVGFIALTHMEAVVGESRQETRGRIRLYTHCSITPSLRMEPQIVTIYMSTGDMDRLNIALGSEMMKYPHQNLFFNHQQAQA